MLQRREATLDWMSQQVYRVVPLSEELQRIKDLFPEQSILEQAGPFYALDMGRPSEAPILLTKIQLRNYLLKMSRCRPKPHTVGNCFWTHWSKARRGRPGVWMPNSRPERFWTPPKRSR